MLQISQQDQVTSIQMCHGKVNAIDIEFSEALIAAIEEGEQSESVCLVIRSNTSNKVFSAGIDLKRLVAEPTSYSRNYLPSLIRLFERIYFCSKPTLAVVEGVAIAGGCVISAACTRRIGTPDAAFGMPNKKLDVPIPQLAPLILEEAVSGSVAHQLHSDQLFSSQQAIDCGLLKEIVHREQLAERILHHAKALSTQAFRARPRDEDQLVRFAQQDQKMIDIWCTVELRTRVSTYIESIGGR